MMNCRLLALSETRSALPPPALLFSSPSPCFYLSASSLIPLSFSPFILVPSFWRLCKRLPSLSPLCTLPLSIDCPHHLCFCPPSLIQVYLAHFWCVTLPSMSHSLVSTPFLPSLCIYVVEINGKSIQAAGTVCLCCPLCVKYMSDHMGRQNSNVVHMAIYLVPACCIPSQQPWQWHISYAVFCNVISLNLPPC